MWGPWVSIEIMCHLRYLVFWKLWVNYWSFKEIERFLDLADEVEPKYDRELLVPYAYSSNEIIFKGLDFPLRCINLVVVSFNWFNLDVLFLKTDFDRFLYHIIIDIQTMF